MIIVNNDVTEEVLEKIYNNEINFEISCFWNQGWRMRLGDELNGWGEHEWYNTFREAITGLIALVIENYPNSEFKPWVDRERKRLA